MSNIIYTRDNKYLISWNEFKCVFQIFWIFSVENVDSSDQMFDANLQVVAAPASAAHESAASFSLKETKNCWERNSSKMLFQIRID